LLSPFANKSRMLAVPANQVAALTKLFLRQSIIKRALSLYLLYSYRAIISCTNQRDIMETDAAATKVIYVRLAALFTLRMKKAAS
jgi:hypothetical protein